MSNQKYIDLPGVRGVPDEEIKKLRAAHREKFPFLQEDKNKEN